MKKIYKLLLMLLVLLPIKVLAAGDFNVSPASITMYVGETKTITISATNSTGRLNISTTNSGVANISTGAIFLDNDSATLTVTANAVGTATISVVASPNYATYDEEILSGRTKSISVNVINKTTTPTQPPTANNLSTNNNLQTISIEGYELIKVDNNNYTLTVSNNVSSVTLNATAEDNKATVSGTGIHELIIGENLIEVVITSESGSKNTINVIITRKDGYYLEDLDTLLNKTDSNSVDIIINSDSKLTNENLLNIKNSGKIVNLTYYDENKKIIYSWTINGSKIKDTNELLTTITFNSKFKNDISKLSNYAEGLYFSIDNVELPEGTTIKLFVGNQFENENIINIYNYNKDSNKLSLAIENIKVTDGYIELNIKEGSEYFATMSKIGTETINNKSNNVFLILSILELIIIIGMIVFYFLKIKKNKKTTSDINIFNNEIEDQTKGSLSNSVGRQDY